MKNIGFLLLLVLLISCRNGAKEGTEEEVSRTSGKVTLLVDESYVGIINKEIEVFKSDYPNAEFKIIPGNESKMLPTFLNDSVRTMVLSRPLSAEEEKPYQKKGIRVYTSRFAIDGIALITHKDNSDSTITAEEVIGIMQGNGAGKNLVFNNPYSSTIRYFKELAKVKELPAKGVYTLQTNDDVIKYVAENKNFIGVLGVNWIMENEETMASSLAAVKLIGVKNIKGKKGGDAYYKPTQANLISGIYPFLRNICIINAEGKDGLATGFANWLLSPRGQLIVLKSAFGPNQIISREFNLKSTK
ncbi:substrate-binding domain-containing protein [Pedobacter sp. MC2016-14]|uniref:PstS family phosphate ABC transporter substrate-binding protein n=1 Tax=Pedobacter sp. MC2016-14 TaxID=2897327 RepID=UPI001E57A9EB|nr:substrate-binding domain-containing protein [Pedobacter sp. MC2016-14]MCD0487508.1 substrate-binding domain-containing protein [Pedobacter sp. MC2016-14]